MSSGCTLGAKKLPSHFFMFKNRDLVYEDFRSHLIFDDRIFAVQGVDISSGSASGVSIGINNSGLSVCSSTVLVNNNSPYDILLEQLLREADTIEQGTEIVGQELESGKRFQWCNILIGSLNEVGVIEIGDDDFYLEIDENYIVRANHHLKLATSEAILGASDQEREAAGPLADSQHRRQQASKMVAGAKALQDFISIVSTHSPSRGFDSICRHRDAPVKSGSFLGETSYSYIIEVFQPAIDALDIKFHVTRKNPCSNPFRQIDVDFGLSHSDKQAVVASFP
ncbi:MAG: hypothetical protein ACFFD3_08145 [Candidatus Thorarchaeota archaeon]